MAKKAEKIETADMEAKINEAREVVRKFKAAFPGSSERDMKAYRAAKKLIAQYLTLANQQK